MLFLYKKIKDRGASDDHIRTAGRAASDIALSTGPHMGEFNGHISPPELIEFVANAASLWQEVFQAKQLKKSAFSTIVTPVDFPRFRSVP